MRRLIHLTLSPSCRLARLMVGEKRVTCDPVLAEDFKQSMPVFLDMDGTRAEGVWAILDHLEQNYPDYPLAPADDAARRACLRWVDWAFGPFHEQVTQRIVYEKAAPRHTDRKSTRPELQSRGLISYAVFCLKKKKKDTVRHRSTPDCYNLPLT